MHSVKNGRTALLLIAMVAFATLVFAQQTRDGSDLVPTGKGWGEKVDHAPAATGAKTNGASPCPNGICYHGGPVMGDINSAPPNIYYIWYGNWNGTGSNTSTTKTLLQNFIGGLNGSAYEAINKTYTINGGNISGNVNFAGAVNDGGTKTSLTDNDIQSIVAAHAGHDLPLDTNGVYFVLTPTNVNESSGFCTQYCGWHTHGTIGGKDIKYAFVGNPDRCPSACEMQSVGPNGNGNGGADGMASIIAHEQEEAISDPDLNAWYDRRGEENADKCAWTFGCTVGSTCPTASNGASYNLSLSAGNFLIQQNWLNANGGQCTMSNP
jgi:hypothetical protein